MDRRRRSPARGDGRGWRVRPARAVPRERRAGAPPQGHPAPRPRVHRERGGGRRRLDGRVRSTRQSVPLRRRGREKRRGRQSRAARRGRSTDARGEERGVGHPGEQADARVGRRDPAAALLRVALGGGRRSVRAPSQPAPRDADFGQEMAAGRPARDALRRRRRRATGAVSRARHVPGRVRARRECGVLHRVFRFERFERGRIRGARDVRGFQRDHPKAIRKVQARGARGARGGGQARDGLLRRDGASRRGAGRGGGVGSAGFRRERHGRSRRVGHGG
mmetsp:Transcript_14128/g.59766  ORF Transcript_14128/g.59766 Transcript_14128/m.59766 type:complete len:278 (+) Transcript_14128:3410-4243(+)